MLFASVFSPASVHALDAATGEIRWRRELPGLGGQPVEPAGEVLLAKTAGGLYAVDPGSGAIRWEFCPYGSEDETMYSEPTLDGKRVFIGDRLGWLYCLDVETGRANWKRRTSDERNCDVNATAAVAGELVITATDARLALAYSVEDGKSVWRTRLDGACTHQVFLVKTQVVIPAHTLHFLEPVTGEMVDRAQWPGLYVSFAAGTPSQIVVSRTPTGNEFVSEEHRRESERLLLLESAHLIREMRCSSYVHAVRYSRATGLLYASGLRGLDILNPETGDWLATLRSAERTSGNGLPEVTENRIYTIDGKGVVSALRHPIVRQAGRPNSTTVHPSGIS